jgi:hypothetical protein
MPGIFLIQDNGDLIEMSEQSYVTENHLQELLAKYPNLLVGDQIAARSPRRWLLVKREMGIPSEEGGSGRWSLDHLFLDQDGIPTLVEVKRSSDTRIRREVVGQMLDYAANGVVYWPVEQIKAEFEKNCDLRELDPQQALLEFLGDDVDEEAFWQQVKTNLYAGKIRMLFVADVIPDELKRIVEFLNSQMAPAEVLAVEVRQYASGNFKTLVPRLIGKTAEADERKGTVSRYPKESDSVRREKALEFLRARPGQEFTAGEFRMKTDIPKAVIFNLLDGVEGIRIVEKNGKRWYSYNGK